MIRLNDQVIVVTGAGRGLGRAYAELLASRGAKIVAVDLGADIEGRGQLSSPADEVVAAIRAAGGSAVACVADIRIPEDAATIRAVALEFGGKITGLVNNAGVISYAGFTELSAQDLQHQLDVHLFGTFHVTQALWPDLVRSGGSVINTTSAGIFGAAETIAYNAAKGAVLGFTRALAQTGKHDGVRVNLIMPGAETRMQQFARDLYAEGRTATAEEAHRSAPEQVAPVVAFLLSDSCTLTGEWVYAGHGHVRRYVLGAGPGMTAEQVTPEIVAAHWSTIAQTQPLLVAEDVFSFRDSLNTPLSPPGGSAGATG